MTVSLTSPSSSCTHPVPPAPSLYAHFSAPSSYQFNPDLYNPDVVINILIKALTSSPFPDFNLCLSLLDERPVNQNADEPDPLPSLLPILTTLYNLLQQCRFPAFWATYRSDDAEVLRDNYTVECVGFENAVRDIVIRAVKAAFKRIGSARLGSYLDLSGMYRISFLFEAQLMTHYRRRVDRVHRESGMVSRRLYWRRHSTTQPGQQPAVNCSPGVDPAAS